MSEVLLEHMDMIEYVKSAGLVLFVWGEVNNDSDVINTLKQKGVNAIIYDKYILFCSVKRSYELRHEKLAFCICENKGAYQLCGNHVAYQRLWFC